MKRTLYFPIAFIMLLNVSGRAEVVFFSWWDSRFANPGLYSDVRGGYSRDARLPDQEDIRDVNSHFSVKTNRELASILVVPPGSDVVGPDSFTARAQTDFGQNHAKTQTIPTGYGESDDREYFDVRHHEMYAESIWADQWTFNGPGLGSATVTLAAGLDVDITSSLCAAGHCSQVVNPIFTRQGLHTWWYRLYGSIRIFDLDVIDRLALPDSDYYDDVPREVGAFEVFQQGSNIAADSFGPLDPYPDVPNSRLAPIRGTGMASFVPVPNHRYAVVGRIHVQSRDGADVNAGHTLSLDHIVLDPGLRLHSVASKDGAHFRILSATRLSATPTNGGQVILSFPTTVGFTYFVEFQNSLESDNWSILESRSGDGSLQNVGDSGGGESPRFYRLRLE